MCSPYREARTIAHLSRAQHAPYPKWQTIQYGKAYGALDYPERAWDCSYYTWTVYRHAGINYPIAGTAALWAVPEGFVEVAEKNARPGDILIFGKKKSSDGVISGHAAIYAGKYEKGVLRMWHNSSPRKSPSVYYAKIDSYYWDNKTNVPYGRKFLRRK